jgi:hypothetical protein
MTERRPAAWTKAILSALLLAILLISFVVYRDKKTNPETAFEPIQVAAALAASGIAPHVGTSSPVNVDDMRWLHQFMSTDEAVKLMRSLGYQCGDKISNSGRPRQGCVRDRGGLITDRRIVEFESHRGFAQGGLIGEVSIRCQRFFIVAQGDRICDEVNGAAFPSPETFSSFVVPKLDLAVPNTMPRQFSEKNVWVVAFTLDRLGFQCSRSFGPEVPRDTSPGRRTRLKGPPYQIMCSTRTLHSVSRPVVPPDLACRDNKCSTQLQIVVLDYRPEDNLLKRITFSLIDGTQGSGLPLHPEGEPHSIAMPVTALAGPNDDRFVMKDDTYLLDSSNQQTIYLGYNYYTKPTFKGETEIFYPWADTSRYE